MDKVRLIEPFELYNVLQDFDAHTLMRQGNHLLLLGTTFQLFVFNLL